MKINDFYSKYKFRLSRSNDIDKFAHVIDEEIDNIFNKLKDDDELILPKKQLYGKIDLSSFKPQHELNPKIWINNKMNSRVRLRLLDIADDFVDTLHTAWVKPNDIILTGSLANYNWSKYSDFDVHILIDFEKVDNRVEFVKDYYDSKKNEWNNNHDKLKIYGFPIELYVQNSKEEHTSSGIYSLEKNKWLKEPEKDTIKAIKLDKYFIKEQSLKYIKIINQLKNNIDTCNDDAKLRELSSQVKNVFDKIKGIRKVSLEHYGEMGTGNIIYKILRRMGYVDILLDLKANTYDKLKSIG